MTDEGTTTPNARSTGDLTEKTDERRTEMMTRIASKAVRLARGTALALGAAVMLALMLGIATTALAGTGVGATFNLGKVNSVNAVSKLVGGIAGSMLVVDNNGTGSALDLQVGPSNAPPAQKTASPMKVDSQARVDNLNADEIDGRDSTEFLGKADKAADSDNLDGIDSTGFVQGNGRVYQGRIEPTFNGGNELVLHIPGIGAVESSCGWYGVDIGFRNQSGGNLAVFIDNGGPDPSLSVIGDGSAAYLTQGKTGNELVTVQVGRGAGQKLATLVVSSHSNAPPCAVQAMAVAQG